MADRFLVLASFTSFAKLGEPATLVRSTIMNVDAGLLINGCDPDNRKGVIRLLPSGSRASSAYAP